MNPWVVSVGSSKGKSRGKITITNVVPLPFDYPMHFSHTLCLLYVESCIELSYDLYILVIVNTHEFLNVIQCIFLTPYASSIIQCIFLTPDASSLL
jgi:hypothetical protein